MLCIGLFSSGISRYVWVGVLVLCRVVVVVWCISGLGLVSDGKVVLVRLVGSCVSMLVWVMGDFFGLLIMVDRWVIMFRFLWFSVFRVVVIFEVCVFRCGY